MCNTIFNRFEKEREESWFGRVIKNLYFLIGKFIKIINVPFQTNILPTLHPSPQNPQPQFLEIRAYFKDSNGSLGSNRYQDTRRCIKDFTISTQALQNIRNHSCLLRQRLYLHLEEGRSQLEWCQAFDLRPHSESLRIQWPFNCGQKVQTIISSGLNESGILETDSQIVREIKDLLTSRVRPFVQDDGGDVQFISFDEETGVLRLKMLGSCSGCPSTTNTLKNGILKMMKYYIGEIKDVIGDNEVKTEKW